MLPALRQSLRRLLATPAATATAWVTITLAFAANVAIFSVVDAVLLEPLPYEEPDRLLRFYNHPEGNPAITYEISHPEFVAARAGVESLVDIAGHASSSGSLTVRIGDALRQIPGSMVSGNLFEVLGVEPLIGRRWNQDDDRIGAAPIVAISERLWREVWAADRDLIGSPIEIGGTLFEVTTILPAQFEYPAGAALWVPQSTVLPQSMIEDVEVRYFNAIGRLAPGRSQADATAELNAVLDATTDLQLKEGGQAWLTSEPLAAELLSTHRSTLLFLQGAALLVLLIAAANVANLQTVRALGRRRDFAVRQALGARRWDLAKLSLLDSTLVALAACGAGSILGSVAVATLLALSPVELFRAGGIGLDLEVWGFALLITALTALTSGLLPLATTLGRRLSEGLHDGGARNIGQGAARNVMRGFVVAQAALAVVLMVGATLLLQSFVRLSNEDPGFDRGRILTFGFVQDSTVSNDPVEQDRILEQVLDRIREVPGVEGAAGILLRPLQTTQGFDAPFFIDGQAPEEFDRNPTLNFEAATPGYFETMGIPILAGRGFRVSDDEDAPGVAVISQTLAATYFGSDEAVGRRFKFSGPGTEDPWFEVIGVAGDGRYRKMDEVSLNVFIPHRQSGWSLNHAVVRSRSQDPAALTAAVRSAVRDAGVGVEIADLATADQILSRSLSGARFQTVILALFAALALTLGAVGLYGVTAYLLSIRRQELGVRIALGAVGRDLVRLVLGESLALSLVGVGFGLAIAFALTRWLSGYLGATLHGVGAGDPWSLGVAVLALVAAALLAGLPPALRAGRTDPLEALRGE